MSDKPSRVAKATIARVRLAAKEMNYYPNRAAAGLAQHKSQLIGMIINDLRNPHISELFMAIDRVVQNKGYSIICNTLIRDRENQTTEDIIECLMAENVAALIWARPYEQAEEEIRSTFARQIESVGIPIATMYDFGLQAPGVDVCFDYESAGYMATRHLIEYGHRRIGCIAGTPSFGVTQERLHGYHRAMQEAGLAVDEKWIYYGDYGMESGNKALSYLLGQKLTGVFAFNDEMAFGVYQSARQYGIHIPEDLSIIGCDNVPFDDVMEVPLTTIRVPITEMGTQIGEKLIQLVSKEENPPREKIVYQPDLLIRGSTRRLEDVAKK
jgi:LacI family transcriptional regulator